MSYMEHPAGQPAHLFAARRTDRRRPGISGDGAADAALPHDSPATTANTHAVSAADSICSGHSAAALQQMRQRRQRGRFVAGRKLPEGPAGVSVGYDRSVPISTGEPLYRLQPMRAAPCPRTSIARTAPHRPRRRAFETGNPSNAGRRPILHLRRLASTTASARQDPLLWCEAALRPFSFDCIYQLSSSVLCLHRARSRWSAILCSCSRLQRAVILRSYLHWVIRLFLIYFYLHQAAAVCSHSLQPVDTFPEPVRQHLPPRGIENRLPCRSRFRRNRRRAFRRTLRNGQSQKYSLHFRRSVYVS